MRAKELSMAVESAIDKRQPIFVWGPPGIGKSSVVAQVAKRLEIEMRDLRAALLDPVDLRGLPRVNGNNRAHWCIPDFLPRGGKGVIFLDEIAQAPQLVQAACLQLTLDRRIGDYVLPDGWSVIAASNRQEDRAGAGRVITPLLNRFLHVDMEVSNEDWQRWAAESGIIPEVRAFLEFRPNLLHVFDPDSGDKAFPTPRSWEFVSRMVPGVNRKILQEVVAGCVGTGAAAEFVAFLRTYRDLPDVEQVIANADTCTLPNDPSILYALVGAIGNRARSAKDRELKSMFRLAGRLPAEYGVLLLRDMVIHQPRCLAMGEAGKWLENHRDLLLGDSDDE